MKKIYFLLKIAIVFFIILNVTDTVNAQTYKNSAYVIGDINFDGKVNEQDATYVDAQNGEKYNFVFDTNGNIILQTSQNEDLKKVKDDYFELYKIFQNIKQSENCNNFSDYIEKEIQKNRKDENKLRILEKVADVNEDQKVDEKDLEQLKNMTTQENKIQTVLGDVNLDGVVDIRDVIHFNKYLVGVVKLTDYQLEMADINIDGNVDEMDNMYLIQYVLGYDISVPTKSSCGDLNRDGEINSRDLDILTKYLSEKIKLDQYQMLYADVNGDGYVNEEDKNILNAYIEKKGVSELPYRYYDE